MARLKTNKQVITAAATFSVALGIGFVMQYGDAVASRLGADAPVAGPESRIEPEAVVIPAVATVGLSTTLEMPTTTLPKFEQVDYAANLDEVETPAMSVESFALAVSAVMPVVAAVVPDATGAAAVTEASAIDATTIEPVMTPPAAATDTVATDECTAILTATPDELAMVNLSLENACRPAAVVSIHHEGMMFNAITDEDGKLRVSVPALTEEAFFIVAYDDGEGAVAITGVPSLSDYDRAVLQWQGEDDLQLHALEFGASYGDAGHVWSKTTADTAMIAAGNAGFLTRLGDAAVTDALIAEVYTFPTGMSAIDGSVALSVEAEVTNRNCGRLVEAQSIQIMPGSESRETDLSMTMPSCDAVGEFLVLKNMFEDLTLASK